MFLINSRLASTSWLANDVHLDTPTAVSLSPTQAPDGASDIPHPGRHETVEVLPITDPGPAELALCEAEYSVSWK